MKVHEYNEMMRWLTRPKVDSSSEQLAAGLSESFPGTFTSYNDAVSEGFQGTREEWLQQQSIPQIDRPFTGKAGGPVYDTRKYFKPGGLVEPGVTHYATLTEAEKLANIETWEKNTGEKFTDLKNENIRRHIIKGETTGVGRQDTPQAKFDPDRI